MNRKDIFTKIEEERQRQDAQWPRDAGTNPQRAQYQFNAPHILLLEEKTARLRSIWYSADREAIAHEFVKIAALAVRALEEVK